MKQECSASFIDFFDILSVINTPQMRQRYADERIRREEPIISLRTYPSEEALGSVYNKNQDSQFWKSEILPNPEPLLDIENIT